MLSALYFFLYFSTQKLCEIGIIIATSFAYFFLYYLLSTCYVPGAITRGCVGYTVWPTPISYSVRNGEMRNLLEGLAIM